MELGASEGVIGSGWLRAGLISLGLAAGLLHGFAFGNEHAGLMQALAFILFSASALFLVSQQKWGPIGEYSPRGLRWLVELLDLRVPQLQVTQDSRATFHVFGVTVVPSICQDLPYGNDLRGIDDSPRLLVNLSNFSFFSSSLARRQFIDIARTRALEQQVPVVVASNLGPSVFVNADGTVAAQ